MAKKPLTPEQAEIKAMKKAKSSENWTKFWAVLLAAVLTVGVVFMGKTAAEDAIEKAKANQSTETNNTVNNNTSTDVNNGGNTVNSGDTTNSGGASDNGAASDGGASNNGAAATNATADAVKILNTATAKVAKGNYKWERKCYLTNPIDVGNATDTLNGIIHRVDENASLDSVVGGFLGVTGGPNDPAWSDEVKGGKFTKNPNLKSDYLMKAFALTEADVTNCQVNGNTYTLTLQNCSNPQKDGSNALHHVTNDFITLSEVQEGVANALGSLSGLLKVESADVQFSKITVVAEVDNGNLKSVQISYFMDVKALNLKATLAPITGKGAGNVECKYSNFS